MVPKWLWIVAVDEIMGAGDGGDDELSELGGCCWLREGRNEVYVFCGFVCFHAVVCFSFC